MAGLMCTTLGLGMLSLTTESVLDALGLEARVDGEYVEWYAVCIVNIYALGSAFFSNFGVSRPSLRVWQRIAFVRYSFACSIRAS